MFDSMSGQLFNMATIAVSEALKLGNDAARQLDNKPDICTCINCHKWLDHKGQNFWVLWCSEKNHSGDQGDILISKAHADKAGHDGAGEYGFVEDVKSDAEIHCFFEAWPLCLDCIKNVPHRFLLGSLDRK